MSDIKLVFRGFGQRPPPFTDLLFDVSIPSAPEPRWLVFPLFVEAPSLLGELLASSVEICSVAGKGRVRIARFLGKGSFQLLRVAAGVRVKLARLPITFDGDALPAEIDVPVLTAQQLRIGGQDMADWLSLDLTTSADADVDCDDPSVAASQDTPGGRALSVDAGDGREVKIHVMLKSG
jgi:hypothetical protein